MKKLMFVGFFASFVSAITLFSVPAMANAAPSSRTGSSGSTTSQTGNDVSWPQCSRTLPKGQLFGIVGINGGLANNTNSCFSTELNWAQLSIGGTGQDKAALYVNTANPGNLGVADWPKTGSSIKFGNCSGADNQACAYIYGWNIAQADATSRVTVVPSSYKWWLDVETGNSWETNTANNTADLEGMVDYFQAIGARVGLYSTSYQWGKIAGKVSATSSLYGFDSWLPGASSISAAKSDCSLPALTGGKVTLTQYVSKQTDYDYSCI